MKESEIIRALKGIGVFVDDVRDITAKQRDIATDVLRVYSLHGDGALAALRCLINYAVDKGEVDLTEEFTELHKTASDLTFGKYGQIPEDDEDEERNRLFAHVAIRIADIWLKIQGAWEWMEAHEGGGIDEASTHEGEGIDEASTPEARFDALKELFTQGNSYKACKLVDAINAAIQATKTPSKQLLKQGKGYKKVIAKAAKEIFEGLRVEIDLRKEYRNWNRYLKKIYEAMGVPPTRYDRNSLYKQQ